MSASPGQSFSHSQWCSALRHCSSNTIFFWCISGQKSSNTTSEEINLFVMSFTPDYVASAGALEMIRSSPPLKLTSHFWASLTAKMLFCCDFTFDILGLLGNPSLSSEGSTSLHSLPWDSQFSTDVRQLGNLISRLIIPNFFLKFFQAKSFLIF